MKPSKKKVADNRNVQYTSSIHQPSHRNPNKLVLLWQSAPCHESKQSYLNEQGEEIVKITSARENAIKAANRADIRLTSQHRIFVHRSRME